MSPDIIGKSGVSGTVERVVVGRPFHAVAESLVDQNDGRQDGAAVSLTRSLGRC